MIISDEEYVKFIKDGKRFSLEILGELFLDNDEDE